MPDSILIKNSIQIIKEMTSITKEDFDEDNTDLFSVINPYIHSIVCINNVLDSVVNPNQLNHILNDDDQTDIKLLQREYRKLIISIIKTSELLLGNHTAETNVSIELDSELKKLISKNQDLYNNIKSISKMIKISNEEEIKIKEKKETCDQYRKELDNLQISIEKYKKEITDYESMKTEIDSLKRDKKNMEKEILKFRSIENDLNKISQEMSDLQNQKDNLIKRCTDIYQKISKSDEK